MMAGSRLPLVSNDLLLLPDRPGEQQAPVIVGSDVWYTWLTSESTRSFTFRSQLGTFTAWREQKRNGWYWYIYRKQQGKLHKAYLGRTKELSLERLNTVTATLVSRRDTGVSEGASEGKSSPLPTSSVDDKKASSLIPNLCFTVTRSLVYLCYRELSPVLSAQAKHDRSGIRRTKLDRQTPAIAVDPS